MNMSSAALSYHEPNIESILILCSFLLLLNIVNYILDRLVCCGLVGHIIIGIAWGTPGANWLLPALQHAVMQLGYLGLILVVYEGM
jgi:Kef-type K+ transport system membrane component KefB